MSFSLTTSKLVLRDFTQADISHYVAQCQDPKYQRFYNDEDCSVKKSTELAQLFIAQATECPRAQFHLAICCKDSKQYLGIAALRLEPNQQASIGCGLKRCNQGKGVSEEAMAALVDFGFNQLNVSRIYAETLSRNKAAIKLCTNLGFSIAEERINDRYFKDQWWNTTVLHNCR